MGPAGLGLEAGEKKVGGGVGGFEPVSFAMARERARTDAVRERDEEAVSGRAKEEGLGCGEGESRCVVEEEGEMEGEVGVGRDWECR